MLDSLETGIRIDNVLSHFPDKPKDDGLSFTRVIPFDQYSSGKRHGDSLTTEAYLSYIANLQNFPLEYKSKFLTDIEKRMAEAAKFSDLNLYFILKLMKPDNEFPYMPSENEIEQVKKYVNSKDFLRKLNGVHSEFSLLEHALPLLSLGRSISDLYPPLYKEYLKDRYEIYTESDLDKYENREDDSDILMTHFFNSLRIAGLSRIAFPGDPPLMTAQDEIFKLTKQHLDGDSIEAAFFLTVLSAQDVLLDQTGLHLSFDKQATSIKNSRPLERKF